MNEKFWVYWVFAVPATLFTWGLWLSWQWFYRPVKIGEEEKPVKKFGDLIGFLKRGGTDEESQI